MLLMLEDRGSDVQEVLSSSYNSYLITLINSNGKGQILLCHAFVAKKSKKFWNNCYFLY